MTGVCPPTRSSTEADLLTQFMYECLQSSAQKPLAAAFQRLEKGGSGGATVDMVSGLKKLNDDMRSGCLPTRLIRCIKPCVRLVPGGFSLGYVAHQLGACRAGVDVGMQQLGYPIRLERKAFWNDFHVLDPHSRRTSLLDLCLCSHDEILI